MPLSSIRLPCQRRVLHRYVRSGLSLLLAAALAMYVARDSLCLITDSATDVATQPEWLTLYSKGQELLKEAESMREKAKAALANVKAEDVSGKFSEAQANAIAEVFSYMALAKSMYLQAEANLKEAKSELKQEMKSLRKQARAAKTPFPESIDEFSKQLDEVVKMAGANVKHIDNWLKTVEKTAR